MQLCLVSASVCLYRAVISGRCTAICSHPSARTCDNLLRLHNVFVFLTLLLGSILLDDMRLSDLSMRFCLGELSSDSGGLTR